MGEEKTSYELWAGEKKNVKNRKEGKKGSVTARGY